MKYLKIDKLKNILLLIAIVYGVFATINSSYAAGNGNNQIYTRDELSSKVSDLETANNNLTTQNNELKKIGNYIFIEGRLSNVAVNTEMDIPNTSLVYPNYDTSLFSYSNDTISIRKAGNYMIAITADMTFTTQPGMAIVYCKYNGNRWFGISMYYNTYVNSVINSSSRIAYLGTSDVLKLNVLNLSTNIQNGYITLQIMYMGDSSTD